MAHSATRPQLLYIGNDPLLSKSSGALLRAAGYKVRSTNPFYVNEALREHQYAAILLCPTLSNEETNAVVKTIKVTQADVPIISIHVGMLGDIPHPASALVIDALQGPHAFVGGVRSITFVRQKVS